MLTERLSGVAKLHCRREVAVTIESSALRPEERAAKALSPEAWPVVSLGVVHRRVRGFWISITDLGTRTRVVVGVSVVRAALRMLCRGV